MQCIKIRGKITPNDLLILIYYISFFQTILQISFINYLVDLILIVISLYLIKTRKFYLPNGTKLLFSLVFFLLLVTIVSWSLNDFNLLYALWGLRNNFRFFVYLYFCILFLTKNEVNKVINFQFKIFPLHLILVFIEFFILKFHQDRIGGIFGTEVGSNGPLMIYLCEFICILIWYYFNKKISTSVFIIYLLLIIINAAISELKALFFFIVIVILSYAIFSKTDLKKVYTLLSLGVILIIGLKIIIYIYPSYEKFFNVGNVIKMLGDTNASYTFREGLDISRTSAFSKITPLLQEMGGIKSVLIGIGLGNADFSSSFSFLNTPFYNTYYLSNYNIFSTSFLYLELGIIGVIIYLSIFIVISLKSTGLFMAKKDYQYFFSQSMGLLCIFLFFYNSSLRTNSAFMIYLFLSYLYLKN